MNKTGRPIKDYTGQKIGHLLVLRCMGTKNYKAQWECKCDCGNIQVFSVKKLNRKGINSCGNKCPKYHENRGYDGRSKEALHSIWQGVKARSTYKYECNKTYWDRGMDKEWRDSYAAFKRDMGDGYKKGMEIDRIDNSKGYFPGNCRWVDKTTNIRNQPKYLDNKYNMKFHDSCKNAGLPVKLVARRMRNGWSFERAVSTAPKTTGFGSPSHPWRSK